MTSAKRAKAAASPRTELDESRLLRLAGYATTRAAIEFRRKFDEHLGPIGVKMVDYSILVLAASNPRVNQKQLGRMLAVSAPNMAIILDRLVERGWVERVRGTEDRREQLIHLTAAGRRIVQQAEPIAMTMETQATSMLSEAERMLLIELLMKVARGAR